MQPEKRKSSSLCFAAAALVFSMQTNSKQQALLLRVVAARLRRDTKTTVHVLCGHSSVLSDDTSSSVRLKRKKTLLSSRA